MWLAGWEKLPQEIGNWRIVDYNENMLKTPGAKKEGRTRRSRRSKSVASADAETAAPQAELELPAAEPETPAAE